VKHMGFEKKHGRGIVTKSTHRQCSASDRWQQSIAHGCQRGTCGHELSAIGRRTILALSTVQLFAQGMPAR